jgi:uncharacterized protein (TIGR00156 family)
MKVAYGIGALAIVGLAAHAQTGGFSGPDNRRLVTAAEVAELSDETSVRLVGYIVETVGDESYTFKDDSGTVVVEIDSEDWNGLEVTPDVKVEILGEVDRDYDSNNRIGVPWRRSIEIDVGAMRLAD